MPRSIQRWDFTFFEIPQIPGYRRPSRRNKSVAGSLMTTAYAVPLAIINPYLAGGIFVDYLVRGRYPLVPKNTVVLAPDRLYPLTWPEEVGENPGGAGVQPGAVLRLGEHLSPVAVESPGLKEIVSPHE